jgi:hypothetical protein
MLGSYAGFKRFNFEKITKGDGSLVVDAKPGPFACPGRKDYNSWYFGAKIDYSMNINAKGYNSPGIPGAMQLRWSLMRRPGAKAWHVDVRTDKHPVFVNMNAGTNFDGLTWSHMGGSKTPVNFMDGHTQTYTVTHLRTLNTLSDWGEFIKGPFYYVY